MALTRSHVFLVAIKTAQLNQEDPVDKSMQEISEELRE